MDMIGLDRFITKNATLTGENEVDAHPIQAMKFSVSRMVCVAVQCNARLHLICLSLWKVSRGWPSQTLWFCV